MAKKAHSKAPAGGLVNRRARFDYELGEDIVAGLVLTGPEVRAARDGHVQLKGAFVSIKDNELWLNNTSFSVRLNERGQNARSVNTRARKILANRKQIDHFIASRSSGMSIVPTKLLTTGHFIKVVIAIAKGRKRYDKRETIKRRDLERDKKHLIR